MNITPTLFYLLKCRYNLGESQIAEYMAQGRLREAADLRRHLPKLKAEIVQAYNMLKVD